MIFYYIANTADADAIESTEAHCWDDVIKEMFVCACEDEQENIFASFGGITPGTFYQRSISVQKAIWEKFKESPWYPIQVSDTDGERYDALEELGMAICKIQRESSNPTLLEDYYIRAVFEQGDIIDKYRPAE